MYYPGQIVAGRPGTPSWYNSAASMWRDPERRFEGPGADLGARAGRSDQSPRTWPSGSGRPNRESAPEPIRQQRHYSGSAAREWWDAYSDLFPVLFGNVSYISEDGLTFALEGQVPSSGGDPKAILTPDGRNLADHESIPGRDQRYARLRATTAVSKIT